MIREYVKNVKKMLVKTGLDYKVKIFDVQKQIDVQFDQIRNREMEDYDYSVYHSNSEVCCLLAKIFVVSTKYNKIL